MQNLVVNGCSFTQETDYTRTWASFLREKINPENYINLAQGGAGNKYICDSTISFLESNTISSKNTLIIIMWSGVGRKDLHISEEWFFYFKEYYDYLCRRNDETCYLHSGGLTNSWLENKKTRKIFENIYKISDPLSICIENLLFFIHLKSYLKSNNYKFYFTNYFNTWNPAVESTNGGDYCIGHFCTKHTLNPIYQNFDFDDWIFLNDAKDCLGDLAEKTYSLDSTRHPIEETHSRFANALYSKLFT